MNKKQCKHTFEITRPECRPCNGLNEQCSNYIKRSAEDNQQNKSDGGGAG